MGKVLTQAQKTFTDLYDSYVLNLSSDIVAVPCDQDGKAVNDHVATITYNANTDEQSVGVTCTGTIPGTTLTGVQYNTTTSGSIVITIPKDTVLPDDAETGFTFTANNSSEFTFTKYITFIKIVQGADGENAKSFQIKSDLGDTFAEGISEITMTTVAFDGVTEVQGKNYAWYYYDAENDVWHKVPSANDEGYGADESAIIGHNASFLTVKKTDVYANAIFKCVITYYDDETDEDYYALKLEKYNYETTVKFFGGTNTMSSADPFVVAYVDLYKDYQKEDVIEAEYYYYHENSVKDDQGIIRPDFSKVEDSYKVDGNLMYVIYEDTTVSGGATSDTYTISTDVSPANAGTVIGGGTYEYGKNIILTAAPKDGYEFIRWVDSDGFTNNPRTITVTGDATYTASFAVATTTKCSLTVNSSNVSMGSAHIGSSVSAGEYEKGTVVTITATANSGYEFVDWYENGVAQNLPKITNVKVDKSKTLTAQFRTIASGNAVADTIAAGDIKDVYVYKNETTRLQFVPEVDGNYKFYIDNNFALNTYLRDLHNYTLSQSLYTTEPSITYHCTAGQVYYFDISIHDYEFNAGLVGVGVEIDTRDTDYTVTLTANNDSAYEALYGAGSYPANTTVSVTAIPRNGFKFSHWTTLSGQTITDQTYTFTITSSIALEAHFTHFSLSDEDLYYFIGVTPFPDALCGYVTGADNYLAGNTVILRAYPNTEDGYYFAGWYIGDELQSTSNPHSFTASKTVDYTALFERQLATSFTLTTAVDPANCGTISVYPEQSEYGSGDMVSIIVEPIDGFQVNGWTLRYLDSGKEEPWDTKSQNIAIPMIENMHVIAHLGSSGKYTIAVQSSDQILGSVTGGGKNLPYGSTTEIAAIAKENCEFVQWDDGNTDNPRTVTVTGTKTYTAIFEMTDGVKVYCKIRKQSADGTSIANDTVGLYKWNDAAVAPDLSQYLGTDIVLTGNNGYDAGLRVKPGDGRKIVSFEYNVTYDDGSYHPSGVLSIDELLKSELLAPAMDASGTLTGFAANCQSYYNNWTFEYVFYFGQDSSSGGGTGGTPTTYTITVKSDDIYAGTVKGSGIYAAGAAAQLTAEPGKNYDFWKWNDGNTDNPRWVTVTGDATYTAYFKTKSGVDPSVFVCKVWTDSINDDDKVCILDENMLGTTSHSETRELTVGQQFTVHARTDDTTRVITRIEMKRSSDSSFNDLDLSVLESYDWLTEERRRLNYPMTCQYPQLGTSQEFIVHFGQTSGSSGGSSGGTGYATDTVVNGVLYIADGTVATKSHKNQTNFSSVVFPSTVTTISTSTFDGCTGLTAVTLPSNLTTIGLYAFNGCNKLSSISIPNSVIDIGGHAFSECLNLTNVSMGSGVRTIGQSAFTGCTGLTSIVIGRNVTTINDQALSSCRNLQSITIPKSVTTIGNSVSMSSPNISMVYYEGSEADWNNISIGSGNGFLINAPRTYNYVYSASAEPMMMSARPTRMLADVGGIETYAATNSLRPAKYKAQLYKYNSGSWTAVSENSRYVYQNDLYDDVLSNVVVISKEDVANYRSVDFTIYTKTNPVAFDNDLIIARASVTVFDLNDPIISTVQPQNAKEGQLWLDTSQTPYVLYAYQDGKWEYFNQQKGQTIYTTQPETYTKDDIWILSEDYGDYGKGTMLTATQTVAVKGGFHISHWTDATPNLTDTVAYIKECFSYDETGVNIAQKVMHTNGKITSPFYVHIDSQKMGFHSVVEDANNQLVDTEVVHIGNSSAEIQNAKFKGNEGTKFDNDASFYNDVNILNQNSDGSVVGFSFQTEDDGSFSLVLVKK